MSHTDLIDYCNHAGLELGEGGGIDMVLIYYETMLLICWHNCYLSCVRTCIVHLNVTILRMYFNISLLLVVTIFVLLVFIGQA